jgi:hypothetical protein
MLQLNLSKKTWSLRSWGLMCIVHANAYRIWLFQQLHSRKSLMSMWKKDKTKKGSTRQRLINYVKSRPRQMCHYLTVGFSLLTFLLPLRWRNRQTSRTMPRYVNARMLAFRGFDAVNYILFETFSLKILTNLITYYSEIDVNLSLFYLK